MDIIITKRDDELTHFEFEYPYLLLLLPLIICIYKCPAIIQKRIFPHTHFFGKFTSLLNREKLLYSIIFALLVTALASPISYDAKLSQNREGRDLVFVLDTSGSMGESGYSEDEDDKSKFEILKSIIASFITHRYDDNVGVCVFGSFAFCSVPLTYDMKAVAFLLNFLEVGIAGENTAIGEGISSALDALKKGHAKEKVIILITDGYQNSGSISVKSAVERAKNEHVRIYTLGVGEPGSYDAKLLKRIAKETGGKMFGAQDAKELQEVYRKLDTLEPSPIRSQNYLNKHMLFAYPLVAAVLLLLYLLYKRSASWSY